jgi:hypothetical protein
VTSDGYFPNYEEEMRNMESSLNASRERYVWSLWEFLAFISINLSTKDKSKKKLHIDQLIIGLMVTPWKRAYRSFEVWGCSEILQVDVFFVFNQSLVVVLVVSFLDEMKSPVFFSNKFRSTYFLRHGEILV